MLAVRPSLGFAVRPARLQDAAALARVRAASWRAAYASILPPAELQRVSEPRSTRYLLEVIGGRRRGRRSLVVTDRTGEPFGYALCGPQQDRCLPNYAGEVYELYLHPDRQRLGAGSLLLGRAIWDLVGIGLDPVMLWVLATNDARHFYESCGGTLLGAAPITIGSVHTTKLAYGWADALPLPL